MAATPFTSGFSRINSAATGGVPAAENISQLGQRALNGAAAGAVLHAAGLMGAGLAKHDLPLDSDRLQKRLVVADHDQRTVESFQRAFQFLDRSEIEMVG